MNDCIFCRIARGEILCYKVYEDKEFLAFLDINPYASGHILIIPKKHYKWLWDMPENEYIFLMKKAYYLADVLRKAFDTEWIEEVVAGIGVEHAHIHLLPRQKDDGMGELPRKPLEPKLSEKEMKEILEKIKDSI